MMATSKDLFSVLSRVYNTRWSDDVEAVLLRPPGSGVRHSYVDALDALAGVGLQADMLPLAIVDDHSVACVALNDGATFSAARYCAASGLMCALSSGNP